MSPTTISIFAFITANRENVIKSGDLRIYFSILIIYDTSFNMLFNPNKVSHYALTLFLVMAVSTIAGKFTKNIEPNDDEEIIRNYLLNESPLYGYNRPKLWIHSNYEINARRWKDFYSRNTTDLNQPYIHLTIKSIINHCGHNFNICLIDDESFSKLLPSWDVNLSLIAEPVRSQLRELGMAKLLHVYGGMVLPNTFVCMKDLTSFYNENLANGTPFICEAINHSVNLKHEANPPIFAPNTYIMGSNKNDPNMLKLVESLQKLNSSSHISSENSITGATSAICRDLISQNQLTLVGGESVGVKSAGGKPILLENLLEEAYLDLHHSAVGIYIPGKEILMRIKYQWFARLSSDEILKSNLIISKYLMVSAVDSEVEYFQNKSKHSVVAV